MTAALAVTGLVLGYGGIDAIKGISFQVARGQTVCFIGANGAGKTTLLRGLSGLIPARAGSIRFYGRELAGRHAAAIAQGGIAHVPEGREVFSRLTVAENLCMGGYWLPRRKAFQRQEQVFETFPRLRERRGQMAGLLSGGEQQMVAIGRAIMADARLILLDEPSMGLAPKIVDEIFEVIVALQRKQTTILLVEQNAGRALACADYAYVLETGSIVLQGAGRDLAADPRIAAAYLGHTEGV
jgi:branched-chain amino acid transport system ATP-binding protein